MHVSVSLILELLSNLVAGCFEYIPIKNIIKKTLQTLRVDLNARKSCVTQAGSGEEWSNLDKQGIFR